MYESPKKLFSFSCFETLYKWKYAAAAKSLQSCLTMCDPVDGSPPGSSVHGIFQARVLEWSTIAFSALVFSKEPPSPS